MNRLFGDLAALSARTRESEQAILDRAMAREGEVRGRLDELRPRAVQDEAAGKEYRSLVLELGKLQQVIATARERLAPTGSAPSS